MDRSTRAVFFLVVFACIYVSYAGTATYFDAYVKTDQDITFQVFYNVAGGFYEQHSECVKIEKSNSFQRVRIQLPRTKIFGIRVDPLEKEGMVLLKDTKISGGYNRLLLVDDFPIVKQAQLSSDYEGLLHLVTISKADDPCLLLTQNIFPIDLSTKSIWNIYITLANILIILLGFGLLKYIKFRVAHKNFSYRLLGVFQMFLNAWRRFDSFMPLKGPTQMFCFFALTFGLIFITIIPPFQNPDEDAHFYRTVKMAEGHLTSAAFVENNQVMTYLKADLVKIVNKIKGGMPHNPSIKTTKGELLSALDLSIDSTEIAAYPDYTYSYNPIPYIPASLAVRIGMSITRNPIVWMYLGRVANLLVWTALVAFAIWKIPFGKWILLFLALTPMSLNLAGAITSDSILNGVAFCFIAICLAFSLQKRISLRDMAVLALASLILGGCKAIYYPLFLLYFLMPPARFGGRRQQVALVSFVVFLIAGMQYCWSFSYKNFLLNHDMINASAQFSNISNDLYRVINIIVTTIQDHNFYLDSFIAQLGWLDTIFPGDYIQLYLSILLLIALLDGPGQGQITLWRRLVMIGCMAIVSGGIMVAGYLLWSGIGALAVCCIQGRYFIPISPLVLLAIGSYRFKDDMNIYRLGVVAALCYSLTQASEIILGRYYGWN